jgi:two-component system phosphate regulon sensor histidine kinase PhoR
MMNMDYISVIDNFVETVSTPIIVIDDRSYVISSNKAAVDLLGSDFKGRHFYVAIRQPLIINLVENAFTAKGNEKENFYKSVSGVERTYEVTAEYSSELKIVSLSFYDTTDAVQANQMRRDFVANVSHELKSPLTSILGFIETLSVVIKSNPLKANEFLKVMERESLRMSSLIDDLLGLSRVEAAEKQSPTEQVDLSEIMREVLEILTPTAAKRNISIKYVQDASDPLIMGDYSQIVQVFTNLLQNAIKYGGDGNKIKVIMNSIEYHKSLLTTGYKVSVEDTGIGIEEHHLARLTERFYRVDDHRSRNEGGTGLGLSIVKHIMARHNGRLLIESDPGSGSEFSVIFPDRIN